MSDGSAASSGRIALRVAAVVLLVLVVAPFVVTGMPSVIGADESFVVLSGSMNAEPEPIIQPGDVVIVDGVNPSTIEEQDIITFSTGADEPVTHRVVNLTEQDGQVAFRTKGDANEDADQQLIGPDQVIGEVILVIPLIGHVVNFANTTQGFVLLVLLPIGLLVLSEIWNLLMADGESSEEDSEPDRSPPTDAAAPAVESEADEDDDGPSTVSLGRAQMGWITVGLVPIAAAAGYLAFRLQTAWILTAFFASVGLTVLSGLLYLRIRWGESGTAEPAGTTRSTERAVGTDGQPVEGATVHTGEGERSTALTTVEPVVEEGVYHRNPVVTGRIENALGDGSRVEVTVDSREELVGMALEKGTWVVHDADAGTHVLVDDEMVFRYDEGANAIGPASTWEEESGWVTFSGGEEATERTSGSRSDHPDGAEQASTTERAAEPMEPDEAEPTDVAETERREPTVSASQTGSVSTSEEVEAVEGGSDPARNGDEATPVGDDDEGTEVVPAIRRVDDSDSDEDPVDDGSADGGPRMSDGSVGTDGGTDTYPSGFVGIVARVVRLPILGFAVLGYLVVEPPATLYRALQSNSDGDEKDAQADTRSEGES